MESLLDMYVVEIRSTNESGRRKAEGFFPLLLMASFFVLIDGFALLVTSPFEAAGAVVFENPDDPSNLLTLFLTLLLTTAMILIVSRFRRRAIRGILLGVVGLSSMYFFYFLSVTIVPELLSLCLSIAAAATLVVTLSRYPEWYVVDASGVIVGAGSIAMFGLSLNISLTIILLVGMAIYDAVSVYKTKHMIDLADAVLESRVPLMLVVPKTVRYSLIRETKGLREKPQDEERKAFFIGLGDIVFPGILFASAYHNVPDNGLAVAMSVTAGTLLGFIVLMRTVVKGRPQAGLPYLSSGAILGYLVSSYLLFGRLVGLTPF